MKVKRTCPICHSEYDADPARLKWGRQTTCSRACSYKARGTGREKLAWFTCAVCGVKFQRCPSHVKGKYGAQFCSRACHYRGRTLGLSKRVVTKSYVYSEAALENMTRASAFRVPVSGIGSRRPEFEDEVAETLTGLGLAYTRQFPLYDSELRRWYACDFFLPDLSMIIEVNCGGHVDPRIRTRSTRGSKRNRQVERDKARRSAAIRAGYLFRELWELDLAQDVEQAVRDAVGV